jgi:hypothetical protein
LGEARDSDLLLEVNKDNELLKASKDSSEESNIDSKGRLLKLLFLKYDGSIKPSSEYRLTELDILLSKYKDLV